MDTLEYEHHEEVDLEDWRARWPNFLPRELACSHCGSLVVAPEALDALQRARTAYGKPVYVAAWYRCAGHPIEAAKVAAGREPGPHSRGAAGDVYPQQYNAQEMRAWLQCCAQENFHGWGMGLKGGSMHFHVDMDPVLGPRAWGY